MKGVICMNISNIIHGSPKDNVITCCAAVSAGDYFTVNGTRIVAIENIPIYHKIAIADIPAGATVFKYGQPIGIASRSIRIGEHVHVQNLESDRGRGDLKKGAAL
jgi:altronate dehydratase small subunit